MDNDYVNPKPGTFVTSGLAKKYIIAFCSVGFIFTFVEESLQQVHCTSSRAYCLRAFRHRRNWQLKAYLLVN